MDYGNYEPASDTVLRHKRMYRWMGHTATTCVHYSVYLVSLYCQAGIMHMESLRALENELHLGSFAPRVSLEDVRVGACTLRQSKNSMFLSGTRGLLLHAAPAKVAVVGDMTPK
eukprot:1839479-Pyramimonas_sp.AAC.2